jgi:hypothetical protein
VKKKPLAVTVYVLVDGAFTLVIMSKAYHRDIVAYLAILLVIIALVIASYKTVVIIRKTLQRQK